MKQVSFILLFVCAFGIFGIAKAQVSDIPQTDVTVDIIPANPGPNQDVSASVVSYSTNINAADITWKINGKTKKEGVGEKKFSFSVGGIGTKTVLDIVVKTQEGETVTKSLTIKPTSVDLIWQSYGFVPPFYKGKSLFSHQNKVTIIALPHMVSGKGQEIPAKNLIYKWSSNGEAVDSASGYGKNTYTFVSSIISRPVGIDVDVSSADTGDTGFASITLSPSDPSLVFYDKSPIYGIEFQKALHDTINLSDSKEITVVGMPFFFGVLNPNTGDLLYKWAINGSPIDNGVDQSTQVFRQKEGTSGTSNISLSIENDNKILQYASNSFNLMFGGTNNTN